MRNLVFVFAAATVFAAQDARAYTLKHTSEGAEIHWERHTLPLIVVKTGDAARDQLLMDAVQGAAGAWARSAAIVVDIREGQGRKIEFLPRGQNESVVMWAQGEWGHDADTLALTFLRYDVGSGDVLDADILVNDADFTWADRSLGETDAYDLQNTITHEMGHALGLAHSDVPEATMFPVTVPSDMAKRALSEDDVSAVQILYGAPSALADSAAPIDEAAGCSTTRAGADPSLVALVVLASMALLFRRRVHARAAVKGLAVVVAAALAAPSVASATQPGKKVGVKDIAARADAVIEGEVLDQRVERREGDILVTVSVIRVDSCVKGACPREMVLEQLGGELDGVGMTVEGVTLVKPGQSLMLAARAKGARWAMVGLDKGNLADLKRSSPARLDALRRTVNSR